MRRRDFIYNSGLLFPAFLISPSMALASQKTIKAGMLIIHDAAVLPAPVAAVFDASPGKVYRLESRKISSLEYSKNGFLIQTDDNTKYHVQKLVVHSCYQFQAVLSSVEITNGRQSFYLEYFSPNKNKVRPEFWFLETKHLNKKAPSFINRNRHAVLCVSDS